MEVIFTKHLVVYFATESKIDLARRAPSYQQRRPWKPERDANQHLNEEMEITRGTQYHPPTGDIRKHT